MAEYDRYINLPGFDNVNRALTLLNVPLDLYRQGDGSVDAIVNPDDLPMRERIGRGIESLVGTAAYGLTPLFARLGGQKAAQAIPEIFTGFSGQQAAEEVVKDVVQDPGRRKFLAGAAATVPVAALAPDLITDVATQVAKRGPRGPVTSIFTSAAANIRELKRQIQDLQELRDDINYRDNPGETPRQTEMLEQDLNKYTQEQGLNEQILKDEYNEVFEMLNDDPVLIKNAPDDDLEFVLENVYEDDVNLYDVVENLNLENDMSETIASEIKKRKLHLQKDKNGVDKYPYAKIFIEDYTEINLGPISMPNPSMPMVRETPPDLVKKMRQMRIRSAERIYNDKVDELRKLTDFDEEKIQDIAERAKQEELKRMYMGGPVEGIASLNNVARDMYRGPRGIGTYQQFADGGAARTISEYRQSLFGTESFGGDTEAVNERTGALGASQAMPETIGDFKKDTGESFSNEAFLKDPDLQEKFQDWFERKTLDYIADNGLDRFIGKQVKGIPVTLSGMMAMAHLGGNYGMRQFLETDGRVDPSDNPNNPDKGTKLSDYLQTHGGLNVYTPQPLNREALVMSQPVAPRNPVYSASFYNNPAFFQKPVPRPTELAPQQEEVKNAVVKELQTPSMVEKYGMPLQVPQGIGSLSETARLMYN